MPTFDAILAVLLAAHQVSAGPITVAKRGGTTSTTSLNPYSKPSGAHIITFSGLTKAWPTDSESSAGSTHWPPYTVEWSWPTSLPSGVASPAGTAPLFSLHPGGPIIPACPVVICYFSGSEVFEPTSAWGTLASSAPTASSSVSGATSPASETSS
ncbi:hypothetical protein DICSQDRAFT_150810 [Dichomitus squalens LYAD-421 SS1]|uniref:Uncharacterized protein n=1 Tax=Dichomitus squalens (strain LYAD-421) TaxID=732165 RepID=R7SJ71_DICSQ|nr:uncharacterized protein DICSQDRAFT_150810 [Dichomitus squalens LYAD-421 SS1]EJF55760.1 hypothetical protein DICSQDRAFT_150810 [Dichomitus squalens LYAD-421 SS1]